MKWHVVVSSAAVLGSQAAGKVAEKAVDNPGNTLVIVAVLGLGAYLLVKNVLPKLPGLPIKLIAKGAEELAEGTGEFFLGLTKGAKPTQERTPLLDFTFFEAGQPIVVRRKSPADRIQGAPLETLVTVTAENFGNAPSFRTVLDANGALQVEVTNPSPILPPPDFFLGGPIVEPSLARRLGAQTREVATSDTGLQFIPFVGPTVFAGKKLFDKIF